MLDIIGLGLIGPYAAMIFSDQNYLDKLLYKYLNINFSNNKDFYLLIFSFLLLGIFFLKSIFSIFFNYLIYKFSNTTTLHIRMNLLKKYFNLNYSTYIERNSSEYLTYTTGLAQRTGEVILSFIKLLSEIILFFFILILLALTNFYAFITILCIFLLFIFFYDFSLKNKIKKYGEELAEVQQIAYKNISEVFGSFKENIIINKKKYFYDRIFYGFKKNAEIETLVNILRLLPRFLLEFVVILIVVIVVITSLKTNISMDSLIFDLSIYAASIIRLAPIVSQLMNNINVIRLGTYSAEKIYQELENTNIQKLKIHNNINNITNDSFILKKTFNREC